MDILTGSICIAILSISCYLMYFHRIKEIKELETRVQLRDKALLILGKLCMNIDWTAGVDLDYGEPPDEALRHKYEWADWALKEATDEPA